LKPNINLGFVSFLSFNQAGTMKNQNSILAWMKDIVNHFWYCCKQSLSEEQFKVFY